MLPIELAFCPLVIGPERNGCGLRPIDPKHPAAGTLIACAPPAQHGGPPPGTAHLTSKLTTIAATMATTAVIAAQPCAVMST